MTPRTALCLTAIFTAAAALAQTTPSRVEQARQFSLPNAPAQPRTSVAAGELGVSGEAGGDDAFGTQQILKRPERNKPFTAFAEASAFFTSNVALARRDA